MDMTQAHRAWQGEDAPNECIECGQAWPCIEAYVAERERADRLAKAIAAGAAILMTPASITDLSDMRAEGRL